MNYSNHTELDDYTEDFLAIHDHCLDVEADWWLEQDLISNCID